MAPIINYDINYDIFHELFADIFLYTKVLTSR